MEAYILSLFAKSAGMVLSQQAIAMNRALAGSLEEPEVSLSYAFGMATTVEGVKHPIYIEADAESIELFIRNGSERDSMLLCLRSGPRFVVAGGRFASEIPDDEL